MKGIVHPNPFLVLVIVSIVALILASRATNASAQYENILAPPTADDPKMEFIENGKLHLGVDLNLGGAITFLAESSSPETNMINNRDWGRQIQMSFYSGPVPYAPDGKQPNKNYTHIGWNPIQVGDYYGHRSKILECKNDGKSLYVKCIPMHWPLDGVPGECTFESWIALDQNTAHVRARINNARANDTKQYPARNQEMPAVYLNGPLYRILTYSGPKPFTGDALTSIPTENGAGFPWHHWMATEHWSALLRADDRGVGIYNPDTNRFGGGFYGKTGSGGPKDEATGYLTPHGTEILDHNNQFEYEYTLIVGSLKEIRQWVYDHAARPCPPAYRFERDRRHWTYRNATDTGWPIRGMLDVDLSSSGAALVGPSEFWRAEDAPRLLIEAAFKTSPGKARVAWRPFQAGEENRRKGERKAAALDNHFMEFEVIPDGQFHTYAIDLASASGYAGPVCGLEIIPLCGGKPGDRMKIKSIVAGK